MANKNRLIRGPVRSVCILALCLLAGTAASRQTQPPRKAYEVNPASFLKLPGKVLSHGRNDTPKGPLKIKTYSLERVKLDPPLQLSDGSISQYSYNLWITGGPFTYAYTVWINNIPHRAFAFGSDRIVVQLFGSAVKFPDGASLAVTPGEGTCVDPEDPQWMLPEKLSVPKGMRGVPAVVSEANLRTVWDAKHVKRYVSVTIRTDSITYNPTRNLSYVMQIAGRPYPAGSNAADGKSAQALVPYDDFAQFRDGAPIIVNWGFCQPGGEFVGRLNKALLDR